MRKPRLRLLVLIAVCGMACTAGPSSDPSAVDQVVTRSTSIPKVTGPTVLAVVVGPLDSVTGDLRKAQAAAKELGYQFIVAPESVPAYVSADDPASGLQYGTAVYVPADRPSGYALLGRGGPEFVRGLAPTAEFRRALRATRRDPLLTWYFQLWPVALVSAWTIAAGLTNLVHRRAIWLAQAVAGAALSLALLAPVIQRNAANPFNNVIERDIVAFLVFAAGVPLIVSLIVALLARRGTRLAYQIVLPAGVASLCIAVSPIYGLIVHCTSGDCL